MKYLYWLLVRREYLEAELKDHVNEGSSWNSDTLIPKMPAKKVNGNKMKIIQLSRHMLVYSSREWRASQMRIDF